MSLYTATSAYEKLESDPVQVVYEYLVYVVLVCFPAKGITIIYIGDMF